MNKDEVRKIERYLESLGFEGRSFSMGSSRSTTLYTFKREGKPDYYFSITEPFWWDKESGIEVSAKVSKYNKTTSKLFEGDLREAVKFVDNLLNNLDHYDSQITEEELDYMDRYDLESN